MAVMAGYLPFLSDMNLFWLGMSGYWMGPCFTCWVQVGAGGCGWVQVGAGGYWLGAGGCRWVHVLQVTMKRVWARG